MKKIFLISTLVLLAACNKKEANGYSITANTTGFEDGTTVYVNTVNKANRPVIIDSTTINANKFSIQLAPIETRDFHFLSFKNIQGNVLYLGENAPIQMTIYKDSLRSSKVVGGKENQLFSEYAEKMKNLAKNRVELTKSLRQQSAASNGEQVSALTNEIANLQNQEKSYRINMATTNPESLVSIMALTDLISLKMIPNKDIKGMYERVTDTLKKTRMGENLSAMLAQASETMDIGDIVEDFTAPTPDGKKLSLKKAMGTVTIVDFWASWCKPCRIENPNVVRIYKKYHKQGLNIIGVSLDRSKDKWVQAIEQDLLEWDHVSNLQFWQEPIARLYGVRSIPATFILDETGKIIAKNLRGNQLEAKIKELLEKKVASL